MACELVFQHVPRSEPMISNFYNVCEYMQACTELLRGSPVCDHTLAKVDIVSNHTLATKVA